MLIVSAYSGNVHFMNVYQRYVAFVDDCKFSQVLSNVMDIINHSLCGMSTVLVFFV